MRALTDRPRPGRPPVYDIDVHLLIIATATSEPPETDAQWTHRLIAGHLRQHHGMAISASQVGRILARATCGPTGSAAGSPAKTTRCSVTRR